MVSTNCGLGRLSFRMLVPLLDRGIEDACMSESETNDRSLNDIASIIWARAWLIAGATVGGMMLAAIVSLFMPKVYRAELSLVVGAETPNASRADLVRALGTWAYVLSDTSALQRVTARLAVRYDAEELDAVRVAVRPIDNSLVVLATVRSRNAKLAVEFAQELLDVANTSELISTFPLASLGPPQLTGNPESP